jgi:hypothetical protein
MRDAIGSELTDADLSDAERAIVERNQGARNCGRMAATPDQICRSPACLFSQRSQMSRRASAPTSSGWSGRRGVRGKPEPHFGRPWAAHWTG